MRRRPWEFALRRAHRAGLHRLASRCLCCAPATRPPVPPSVRLLRSARSRAAARGIPFDLVEGDIRIPRVCPAIGVRIDPAAAPFSPLAPSLDRLDPSRGYVRGNVRVVSWRANRIKSDASAAELRRLAAYASRRVRP